MDVFLIVLLNAVQSARSGCRRSGAAAGGNGFIILLTSTADVLQVLFVGFPARLNLGGLDGIANGVGLGPGEAIFLELSNNLPDLAH